MTPGTVGEVIGYYPSDKKGFKYFIKGSLKGLYGVFKRVVYTNLHLNVSTSYFLTFNLTCKRLCVCVCVCVLLFNIFAQSPEESFQG